jgi:tRNA threonylcarbamoyladenosine biosynthesis protein TsaB
MRELAAEAGIGFDRIDALAVSRGPGGFTSLRIGLGVVHGVALAHDLPVQAVSTLSVLARAADPDQSAPHLLAVLDARMREVYSAWYRNTSDGHERIGDEQVGPPGSLAAPHPGPWLVAGSGLSVYPEPIGEALGESLGERQADTWPNARALLAVAAAVEPIDAWRLEPTYIRDQVTDQKG